MAEVQHRACGSLSRKSSTEVRFPATGGLLNSAKRPYKGSYILQRNSIASNEKQKVVRSTQKSDREAK